MVEPSSRFFSIEITHEFTVSSDHAILICYGIKRSQSRYIDFYKGNTIILIGNTTDTESVYLPLNNSNSNWTVTEEFEFPGSSFRNIAVVYSRKTS